MNDRDYVLRHYHQDLVPITKFLFVMRNYFHYFRPNSRSIALNLTVLQILNTHFNWSRLLNKLPTDNFLEKQYWKKIDCIELSVRSHNRTSSVLVKLYALLIHSKRPYFLIV